MGVGVGVGVRVGVGVGVGVGAATAVGLGAGSPVGVIIGLGTGVLDPVGPDIVVGVGVGSASLPQARARIAVRAIEIARMVSLPAALRPDMVALPFGLSYAEAPAAGNHNEVHLIIRIQWRQASPLAAYSDDTCLAHAADYSRSGTDLGLADSAPVVRPCPVDVGCCRSKLPLPTAPLGGSPCLCGPGPPGRRIPGRCSEAGSCKRTRCPRPSAPVRGGC